MFGSVPVGTGRQQYCPAPRIPLDAGSCTCRGLPARARAAVPGMTGAAWVPAMIVAYVFMVSFQFTVVNTQYGAGRLIETDLASGFAAIRIARTKRIPEVEGNFAETKVFIIQR